MGRLLDKIFQAVFMDRVFVALRFSRCARSVLTLKGFLQRVKQSLTLMFNVRIAHRNVVNLCQLSESIGILADDTASVLRAADNDRRHGSFGTLLFQIQCFYKPDPVLIVATDRRIGED